MRRGLVIVLGLSAACVPDTDNAAPSFAAQLRASEVTGEWLWTWRGEHEDVALTETEAWHVFRDPAAPTQLRATYLRTVDASSTDGTLFRCNQRPHYTLTSRYELVGDWTALPLRLTETSYDALPSPCDQGFRRLTPYVLTLHRKKRNAPEWLQLDYDDATQVLLRSAPRTEATGPHPAFFRQDVAPLAAIAGPWQRRLSVDDERGDHRIDDEQWEVTPYPDRRTFGASYRKRVTIAAPPGTKLPCGLARYAYEDTAVLIGTYDPQARREPIYRVREAAITATPHPCQPSGDVRMSDEGVAELRGDALVIEWRGKRRTVLTRP